MIQILCNASAVGMIVFVIVAIIIVVNAVIGCKDTEIKNKLKEWNKNVKKD